MGVGISTLFGKREAKVLLTGLDNAGKTSILYKLKLGELFSNLPPGSAYSSSLTLDYKTVSFTIWDVGGLTQSRVLWKDYYEHCDVIAFVIDSTDSDRITEAREQLQGILNDNDLLDKALLLVYANKQDLSNAMSVSDITECLGLHGFPEKRAWYVQAASARSGEGLYEGLEWLSDALSKKN